MLINEFSSAINPIIGFEMIFSGVSKYKVSHVFQLVSWFFRLWIKGLASVAIIVKSVLISEPSFKVIPLLFTVLTSVFKRIFVFFKLSFNWFDIAWIPAFGNTANPSPNIL